MSTFILFFLAGMGLGSESLAAQARASENLLSLESGPGYVARQDFYVKSCRLKSDGDLHYIYSVPSNEEGHSPDLVDAVNVHYHLSVKTVNLIKQKIEKIRSDHTVKAEFYNDYSGDAPGFTFVTYPDDETTGNSNPKFLPVHYQNQTIIRTSRVAKSLLESFTALCGMRKEMKEQLKQVKFETRLEKKLN